MIEQAPSSADDAALVSAMSRGDREALSALYDRHAPFLLALIRRIVGGTAEAEDILHEVFLEAWRHAAEYSPARASVKAWLRVRARSRALDVRKSARVSRAAGEVDESWLSEPVDASAASSPDRARLREFLIALAPEQRQVLLLGYFEGLSSSEIAEELGIPIGTVKSRVAAGMAALRRALRDPSEGEP